MAGSGPNPALAPIRRWVLYSRRNLLLSVFGVLVLLFGAGQLFGESPSAAPARVAADPAPSTRSAGSGTSRPLLDELPTLTDTDVAAMTDTDIARSAPATAMAYARAFVDVSSGDLLWATTVAEFGAGEAAPAELVDARPTTSVAITGPTSSTPVTVGTGPRQVRSTVPTEAGDLVITLVADDDDAQHPRWVVDGPLPSLDLTVVRSLQQVPEETAAAVSPAPSPAPAPTRSPVTTTPPVPAVDVPPTAEAPPAPPTRGPDPVPVPGPIPIPDLDTPLPGAL